MEYRVYVYLVTGKRHFFTFDNEPEQLEVYEGLVKNLGKNQIFTVTYKDGTQHALRSDSYIMVSKKNVNNRKVTA